MMGVLRRPQVAADRVSDANRLLADIHSDQPVPTVEPGLTRLAAIVPGVGKIYVLVVRPKLRNGTVARQDQLAISFPGIFLFTATEIRDGAAPIVGSGPGSISQPTNAPWFNEYIVPVPDGVARVRWTFAHVGPVEVRVRGNIAAASLRRPPNTEDDPTFATWLSADGQVIKRFAAYS